MSDELPEDLEEGAFWTRGSDLRTAARRFDEVIDEIPGEHQEKRLDRRPLEHDQTPREKLVESRDKMYAAVNMIELIGDLRSSRWVDGIDIPAHSRAPSGELHRKRKVPDELHEMAEERGCKLHDKKHSQGFFISCPNRLSEEPER